MDFPFTWWVNLPVSGLKAGRRPRSSVRAGSRSI